MFNDPKTLVSNSGYLSHPKYASDFNLVNTAPRMMMKQKRRYK